MPTGLFLSKHTPCQPVRTTKTEQVGFLEKGIQLASQQHEKIIHKTDFYYKCLLKYFVFSSEVWK